ncbi:MAG: malto-oligosyltrehalose synthase [Pseudomonadota bacterium]
MLPLAPGTETIADIAALHEAQNYRVANWRLGRDGLTYRRFFEITGHVGVCVEKTAVFDDVHRLLENLVREGLVHGVRVDHVDGLADPSAYLSHLSERLDVPVLIEKIVEAGEALPPWPVAGTTGYEFIAAMAALLVDGAGLEALSKEYRAIGNDDVGALVRAAKREMVRHNFAGEHSRLGQLAEGAFAQDLAKRDHGPSTLRDGLEALLSAMPVYRTYLRPRAEEPSPRDRAVLAEAVAGAGRQKLDTPQVVDDLAALLLKPPRVQEADEFVTRFQQLSGPVMAKAVEDTVFFRHHRFIGTNEVGGGQPAFGSQAYEAAVMSTGLVASQTHDTKRGADARARLYALSEPQAVQTFATIWPKLPGDIPDGIKWCMAQMLFAAEPFFLDPSFAARFQEAALKTVREAKEETSWTRTNAGFEARIADAAQAMVAEKAILEPLWPVRRAGAVLGLSAAVLQLFGKATPDIYQGGFAWDFSMVDPDNRRPVDFAAEDALCALARASSPQSLLEDWTSGAVKASVLLAGLSCRKRHPALFAEGSLRPVEVTPVDSGIAAFERRLGGEAALAVVPTKPLKHLNQVGISIFLQTKPVVSSAGQFRNLFTGAAVAPAAGAIADELLKFPVFLGVLEA